MKARKLPSGNWFARAYSHTENGKKIYESFTAPTQAEAEYLANKFKYDRKKAIKSDLTVGEAIDQYIEDRSAVLSPTSVVSYKKIRRINLQSLMDKKVAELTQQDVQRAVNQESKTKSPKTVRCAHGLLSAALKQHRKDLVLNTLFPQPRPAKVEIPSNAEITALLAACTAPDTKVIIMLASMLGLRRSEICALKWDDIDGSKIRVDEAAVYGVDGLVTKPPKSASGARTIDAPAPLIEAIAELPRKGETVLGLSPAALSARWWRLKEKAGVSCRFHDLRHYHASVMLALGVPDKYAMERMGHSTPDMLRKVYQHTMEEKRVEVSTAVNSFFEGM